MPLFLRLLMRYRHFILQSVVDDYKKRYARSKFALLWTILHPLVQVIIFALIFSGMLGARLPGNAGAYSFAIYVLAGVLIWGLFADTLNRMTTVFVEYGNQIKKIVFPKVLPVAIAVGIALVNFSILLVITLLFLLLIGNWPGWHLLSLLPFVACAVLLGAGLGLIFGTLNVFMRDIAQFVSIVMTFWFWATPIIYQSSQLPEPMKRLVGANPATALVTAFQDVMLSNLTANFQSLLGPAAIATLCCALGAFMLFRSSEQMADAL